MASYSDLKNNKIRTNFNWRAVWYCVLIWILTFVADAVFIYPWFYIVLPLIVFGTTFYFFRRVEKTLLNGLRLAVFWFTVLSVLDALKVFGPYYSNFGFYFSDFRNWLLFPLILLIPTIYSMFLENKVHATPKKQFKGLNTGESLV